MYTSFFVQQYNNSFIFLTLLLHINIFFLPLHKFAKTLASAEFLIYGAHYRLALKVLISTPGLVGECMCLYVCVCEREREREREREEKRGGKKGKIVISCKCICVRERKANENE